MVTGPKNSTFTASGTDGSRFPCETLRLPEVKSGTYVVQCPTNGPVAILHCTVTYEAFDFTFDKGVPREQ